MEGKKDDNIIHLDYSLTDPQDRVKLTEQIIAEAAPERLTSFYLTKLADYILDATKDKKKKNREELTANRMITLKKRETSFEGLSAKFENGEDGIYSLITNDKDMIFMPKVKITPKDIEEVPGLKDLVDAIEKLEVQVKVATGKRKFQLKQQLIAMRQDQYVLKNAYRKPTYCMNMTRTFSNITFEDNITVDADGVIHDESFISFFNPEHIALLFHNYVRLKCTTEGKFNADGYYLMMDFDNLVRKVLVKYPLYADLVKYKIAGYTNLEIQDYLKRDHGIKHSEGYLSVLWKHKIPKLIADQAEKDYLVWYYSNVEKGYWKRCSKCGKIKLGHSKFFSKNNTAKDGFYSQCKECRNKKKGE